MKFILILCGGTGTQGSPMASDLNRQFGQAEVMLKSAAIFTRFVSVAVRLLWTVLTKLFSSGGNCIST